MEAEVLDKLKKLPFDKQKEVEDFIDFLIAKNKTVVYPESGFVVKKGFGGGKGIFGKMSDDFDEPLDELKDYM